MCRWVWFLSNARLQHGSSPLSWHQWWSKTYLFIKMHTHFLSASASAVRVSLSFMISSAMSLWRSIKCKMSVFSILSVVQKTPRNLPQMLKVISNIPVVTSLYPNVNICVDSNRALVRVLQLVYMRMSDRRLLLPHISSSLQTPPSPDWCQASSRQGRPRLLQGCM